MYYANIHLTLAYRCAYCSQWNPSLKPKPQLAISYENKAITHNGHVISSETIEEITYETSLKNDNSDTNGSEHSEQKDLVTSKIYNNNYFF